MNFKHLADIKVLHEKTLSAARAERAATFHLLECLHRIEKTRAYIELSYPTLFAYVHQALGYAESQAYERIAAMRLAFKIPEVGVALKIGDLTLTSVARIAQHSKRESLTPEAVANLARTLAHRPVREVERVLASEAKCTPPAREMLRPSSASSSTLMITIDSEFEALLKEARELESDPTLSIAVVLKRALKMRVEAKKLKKGWRPELSEERNQDAGRNSRQIQEHLETLPLRTSGPDHGTRPKRINAVSEKSRPYIPIETRQILWRQASGQCSFVSPITGSRCLSRQSLQVDHKIAYALDGSNEPANLQFLCAKHNREKGMG